MEYKAPKYSSFVRSKPFKFLIGPEKTKYYIHAELSAQHSPALRTLAFGHMKEAEENSSTLDDVSEETFVRFLEFAYTGDYSVPEPEVLTEPEPISHGNEDVNEGHVSFVDIAPDTMNENAAPPPDTERLPEPVPILDVEMQFLVEEPPTEDYWGNRSSSKKKDKKKRGNRWVNDFQDPNEVNEFSPRSKKEQMWKDFQSKAVVRQIDPWRPKKNEHPNQIYAGIFLCHADLYVFSDKFGIDALRELALQKLHLTLSEFSLFAERAGDVTALIKYVYANTMEHDNRIDELRGLVLDYAECHVEDILKDKEFQELLQEEGTLSRDLLLRLTKRLS